MNHSSETWHYGDARERYSNLAAKVKPNMKAVNGRANFVLVLAALLIPVGIVLFVSGGVSMTNSFGPGSHSFGPPPQVLIGMAVFIAGGVLAGVLGMRKAKIRQIVILINEVESSDKTKIESLSLCQYTGKAQVVLTIKKLIETKNLPEYELIGDAGVAKITVQARESDFASEISVINKNAPSAEAKHECSNCGAAVTEGNNGKFCKYCGTRLP